MVKPPRRKARASSGSLPLARDLGYNRGTGVADRLIRGLSMRTFLVTAFLLLSANACLAAEADTKPPKPAGELPEIKELPNPFTFADGAPVRTKEDWARRRE